MKILRTCLLSVVILVFACGSSFGQDGTELSLADAVQKGLENNFSIRIARRSLEIASNKRQPYWRAAGISAARAR